MEHYFTNNESLESKLHVIDYNYNDYKFSFWSDAGVFSKNKIDYGSRFLIETILNNYSSKNIDILDVGCGYGFMGITLSKLLSSKVDMIDINLRAVGLASKNILENKVNANVFESNIYEGVTNTYDLIVTNPPIRAGKVVVLSILENAKNYLKDSGEVWFVMRKDHGAKSIEKTLKKSYNCNIVKKSKGFYVFCLKTVDK